MDKFVISNKTCIASTSNALTESNEPRTKRKKTTSEVWSHFDKLRNMLAKCRHCGKEYRTSGNTSNMMEHLRRVHPFVIGDHVETIAPKLDQYLSRSETYAPSSAKKACLDNSLAKMIALDMQPFSVVEDIGFRAFVSNLDPKYILPSRRHLKDVVLKNLYDGFVEKLKEVLSNIKYCSITTDTWTSRANTNYITVTCHFVVNFTLKSAVLSTKPLACQTNHNSDNIATTLREICNDWGIFEKITAAVTDNAASMIRACEILQKRHFPCFTHTLNLVVQDLMGEVFIKEIVSSVKRIVTFFKSSSVATAKFKNAQNTDSPLNLLQEVLTRWNSAFYMLQRVLQTREPLIATLLKSQNAPTPLSEDHFRIVQDLCSVLEPFETATKHTSASKTVTASLVIPAILALTKSLELLLPNMKTSVGSDACKFLMNGIKKRLYPYEGRTVTRLATLLDPRFKKDGFQNVFNGQQAAQILEDELAVFQNTKVPEIEEELPKENDSSFLFTFMDKKISKKSKRACRCDCYDEAVLGATTCIS